MLLWLAGICDTVTYDGLSGLLFFYCGMLLNINDIDIYSKVKALATKIHLYTRWRNYNRYALYLSVHCTALRADISAFVQRYLRPCPKISPSWPEDISARGFHTPINSANGYLYVAAYMACAFFSCFIAMACLAFI